MVIKHSLFDIKDANVHRSYELHECWTSSIYYVLPFFVWSLMSCILPSNEVRTVRYDSYYVTIYRRIDYQNLA